jgi:hypothetical protein
MLLHGLTIRKGVLYVKEILTQSVVAGYDLSPVAQRGQQKSAQEIDRSDADFSDQASPAGFSVKFGQTAPERPGSAWFYVAM